MSVLIKGVEMPTSCLTCGFKINCDDCEGHECYCAVLHRNIGYMPHNRSSLIEDAPFVLSDCRLDDCPLVSIPPHGDLIDRDDLKNKEITIDYDEWDDTFDDGLLFVTDLIDNAPTIIPASEEGET